MSMALLALAACSSNYNLGVNPSLGIGTDVSLAVSGGVTQLSEGTATTVSAIVSNDVNNAGVSWSLIGAGTLTSPTNTTVIYAGPTSGVTGAVSAEITATSIANGANTATVTLITFGTPVINPRTQFPANVNVAYEADISAQGGTAPFTWTLTSGTLPPGLALNGSSTAITSITGTPTTAGTYSFTLQTVDANSAIASVPVTLVVNAQAACLLSGQFTFAFSGFRGGGAATHVGNITISSTGAVTGEQDYKDGHRTTVGETLDTSSNCTNRSTNSGVLTLNAASGQVVYNFSVTPPDSNNVIHSARLQLISSGSDAGSGQLTLTDTTAIAGTPPRRAWTCQPRPWSLRSFPRRSAVPMKTFRCQVP